MQQLDGLAESDWLTAEFLERLLVVLEFCEGFLLEIADELYSLRLLRELFNQAFALGIHIQSTIFISIEECRVYLEQALGIQYTWLASVFK